MILKKLVSICLLTFFFSSLTVLVIGLWIAPNATSSKSGPEVVVGANGDITTYQADPLTGAEATTSSQAGSTNSASPESNIATNQSQSSSSTGSSSSSGTASGNTGSTSSGPTGGTSGGGTTQPPTPPPPSAPACGTAGGSCTVAQVAAHNSQGNCWITYNGGYYIVTSYINQHPGGKSVFNATTCGADITPYLNGGSSTAGQRHTHKSSAYTILNSYYVGPVK